MKSLRGITFLFLEVFSAVIGWCFLVLTCLPLRIFSTHWSNNIGSLVIKYWFSLSSFGIKYILQVPIEYFGDKLVRDESALVICNHHTCVDWLFLWPFFHQIDSLAQLRIVLKSPLKKVPFIGWCMQILQFIFLERNRSDDEIYIKRSLSKIIELNNRRMILLFPEGTDLSERSIKKSHKYSEKMGLPKYNHVLHPRTFGFVTVCRAMQGKINAIYDLTMDYTYHIPGQRTSEKMVLNGHVPRDIRVSVKRFEASHILEKNDKDLASWCCERFKEKEELLSSLSKMETQTEKSQFVSGVFKGVKPFSENDDSHIITFVTTLMFWVYVCFLLVNYWKSMFVRTYLFISLVIFISISSSLFGGLDRMTLSLPAPLPEKFDCNSRTNT